MIQFDESICRNLDVTCRREWLETNGIGGYAQPVLTVGSRTGAVPRRFSLSVAPRFLWECLTSGRPARLTGQSRKELTAIRVFLSS